MDEEEPRPRSRWLRRTLVLVLIGGAAGFAWWRFGGSDAKADEGPKYSVQEVARGDVVPRVTATGTLSPVVTVQVGSQVSGRIKELFADFNDEVKAGQILATLDPAVFESAVARAKAQLSTARANLTKAEATVTNARAEYKRLQELSARGVASRAELDIGLANKEIAEASIVSAKAEVTQSQAALDEAQTNLSYTTIASPIDGIVVTRSVDVGQTVAASLSAPVLFLIAGDLRKMEVHASVAESDIGQLEPELKAEFTVDAFPNDRFVGEIKQVRYEAVTVSNVVTYDAVITVDNDRLKLRPGMTANVTFIIDERRDVLTVPNKALRFRPAGAPPEERLSKRRGGEGGERSRGDKAPEGGDTKSEGARSEVDTKSEARSEGTGAAEGDTKSEAKSGEGRERRGGRRPRTVWVLRDGAPVAVQLRLGLSDGTNTEVLEIVEGQLEPGDEVIVGNANAPGAAATGANRGGGGGGGGMGGGRGGMRIF